MESSLEFETQTKRCPPQKKKGRERPVVLEDPEQEWGGFCFWEKRAGAVVLGLGRRG